MALTDIVSEGGESSSASRGNIGTIADALARDGMSHYIFLSVPVIADVKSGVVYGKQGTELTGTYVAVGGGGSDIHMDVDTGNLYKEISTLLILKL